MYFYPYAQLWSVSDLCCPPAARLLPPSFTANPLPLKLSNSIPPPDIIRRYVTSLAHIHSLYVLYSIHICIHIPRIYICIYTDRILFAVFAYVHMCTLVHECISCAMHPFAVAIHSGLTLRENSASRNWISTLLSHIFHDSYRPLVTISR